MMDGYTADEWNSVVEAPILVNGGVTAADFSIVSFAAEIKSTLRSIQAAKQEYPESAVVQQVATTYETRSKEDYPEPEEGKISHDEMVAKIAGIRDLVRSKSGDQEAQHFTNFLLTTAKRAAEAGGEGLFGTGEKVSDKEQAFLDKLQAALAH